ncbi:MAG: glycosyltransferase [Nitrospirota bacterium]
MLTQIRILHIIDSLNIGGTEKQCVEIAKRTNSEKYNVHLVTLNKEGHLYHDLIHADIPLTEFNISDAFYHQKSIIQIFRLASFMKKKRFHIVQTYGFYSTVPGVIAAKIARVPVIIAGKRDMSELLSKTQIKAEKMLWKFSERIIVNARKIRNYLVSKEGIQKDKIIVIYNGVDLKQVSSTSENIDDQSKPNIVGMIANFRPQKDHTTFLKAAEIVLGKRSDVKFLLVGSGPFEDEMKQYARQLRIHNNVIFYGRKTGKELYDILKNLTVSVLSSTNEGIPNVILESMSFGIPVIANPSGGVPELVEDRVTGFLFPYKRPDILAEKIIYLLDNKKVTEKMGRNGQRKVEKEFNYTVMKNQYERLYEELYQRIQESSTLQ